MCPSSACCVQSGSELLSIIARCLSIARGAGCSGMAVRTEGTVGLTCRILVRTNTLTLSFCLGWRIWPASTLRGSHSYWAACISTSSWITFLSPLLNFALTLMLMQPLGCCYECYLAMKMRKNASPFQCFALWVVNWLLFSLTSVLDRVMEGCWREKS